MKIGSLLRRIPLKSRLASIAATRPPAAADSYKQLESMSLAELESHLHKLEASMKDVTPAATDDDSADDFPRR